MMQIRIASNSSKVKTTLIFYEKLGGHSPENTSGKEKS